MESRQNKHVGGDGARLGIAPGESGERRGNLGKISLNKNIEATKLNERTEAPLVGPPATIPFGALVEPLGASRDQQKFRYLGELYSVAQDVFLAAARSEESDSPASQEIQASPATGEPARAKPARLKFEQLDAGGYALARAKVRGGWLVASGTGIAFYPDSAHEWDGTSID